MSRVDATRIAIEKARGDLKGAVVGSDAFFPFPDAVELAIENGVTAFMQPGGSKGDETADRDLRRARRGHGAHRPAPLPALSTE